MPVLIHLHFVKVAIDMTFPEVPSFECFFSFTSILKPCSSSTRAAFEKEFCQEGSISIRSYWRGLEDMARFH